MNNRNRENLSRPRSIFYKNAPTSMLKDTHELIAEAFERNSSLKEKLAKPFGVDTKSIQAWARPKYSELNPLATGKGNPLDRTESFIEFLHITDPEMAREIAEHFSSFIDELDRKRGLTEAFEMENPCAAISKVIEAQAKWVNTTVKGCDNLKNAPELLANTQKLKTRVLQLEGCLRALLQAEVENA